jgi:hypothetical protein
LERFVQRRLSRGTSFHRPPRQLVSRRADPAGTTDPIFRVHGAARLLALRTALMVNGFFGQLRVWVCKASAGLRRRLHQAAGKFGVILYNAEVLRVLDFF